MCKTRIKMIGGLADFENLEDFEELINGFITAPTTKVAKVNSIKIETYYDDDDDLCMLAIINYELGD